MGTTFLEKEATTILALGSFRAILCDLGGTVYPDTNPALILAAEAIQMTGGYGSQAYAPTTGSYNATTRKWDIETVSVVFEEAIAGSGYQFTDVILWQGRGAISNKPCTVNDSTDRVSCTAHGLIAGDFAFVAATGTLPGGLTTQRYYVEVIDANTVKLHTTITLDSLVDITDTGFGDLRLIHANGYFVRGQNFGLTTIAPGGSASFTVPWKFSYA